MPSAGELLRAERLKRSKTLAEIAEQTRISTRYLEALEVDSIKDLPGDFFYKAFIRQYATALDLDAPTTDRILAATVPVEVPDPLPAMNEIYEKAQVGERERWRPSTGVAIGLLVAVLTLGSLLYAWWQSTQSQTETVAEAAPASAQPVTQPAAQTTPPTTEQTPPQETTPPAAEPAAAATTPQPEATPTQTVPAQTVPAQAVPAQPVPVPEGMAAVELNASESAWVQLRSGGKTLFIGNLEPGQPKQFAVGPDATLRTGNAGAVEVRYRGQAVGPIGPKGQVRTVRFTPDGAQVVAPAPKPVPAPDAPAAQP